MENNQLSSNLGSHGSDQQVGVLHGHSTTTIQAAIGSLIFILLTTLQVMFQNDNNSPFKTHALIMKMFVVFAFVYASVAVASAAITVRLQHSHCTRGSSYVPLLNNLGLVLGAFACDFLLLILFLPFGYFVLVLCILMLLILLLKSYQQIVELIHVVAKLALDGTKYCINAWMQRINYNVSDENSVQPPKKQYGSDRRLERNVVTI